jgi:protoporphyrin/coproporphyrin ferrochelatase
VKKALLLLNMGGPNNIEEVELFLRNMFADKRILGIPFQFIQEWVANYIIDERLEEAQNNYKALGGKSPLVAHTQKLCDKISLKLPDVSVDFVMRYTPPFADPILKNLQKKGIDELYLLPLYPQYSTTTTASSFDDITHACSTLKYHPIIHDIESFYSDKRYIELIVNQIKKSIDDIDTTQYDLVFSAHGLPKRTIKKGDPYVMHIERNVELAKRKLAQEGIYFNQILLAYQSKVGPLAWTEPYLDELIVKAKNRKMVIFPLSFTLDNSETDFELDIEYRELAQEHGYEDYRVCKVFNDDDIFVSFLINLYKEMI